MYLWTVMKSIGRRGGCYKWPGQLCNSYTYRQVQTFLYPCRWCRCGKRWSGQWIGRRRSVDWRDQTEQF